MSTGVAELDRVLGNGLVPGAVILLAGEPGMGKSTLLSQVALQMAQEKLKNKSQKSKVERGILYICGEESPSQVAMRLNRLARHPRSAIRDLPLTLFPETDVDAIVGEIEHERPTLVIIDSIQTLITTDLAGTAGSVGQVRECAGRLAEVSKRLNISIFLVGHVTKEGAVAGPKVLEHVVDVVLVLEGDRSGSLRILRAVKNRFGPVDEVGLFAMEEGGMREVANPAELLIGEQAGVSAGSVLGCVLEGMRPLVLEVQALVVPSKLAVPRRIGHGVNERRLQLLCAVIEKHLGLGIGEKDVFVNVAGGLKSPDPGLDLPVVAAIISSSSTFLPHSAGRKKSISSLSQNERPIFSGEVGLLGEVRQVQGWERREKEVKRLQLGTLVGKGSLNSIRDLQGYLQ